MKGQCEALIFMPNNHCLCQVVMTTKSKYGTTNKKDVCFTFSDIWITSEQQFFITSIHGSFLRQTIKLFESGIGNLGVVSPFWQDITIMSCVQGFTHLKICLFLHHSTKPFEFGTFLVIILYILIKFILQTAIFVSNFKTNIPLNLLQCTNVKDLTFLNQWAETWPIS